MDLLFNKNLVKKNLPPNPKKSLSNLKEIVKNDRSSPSDEKCPICLVLPIENKSFCNFCFHAFCKVCLIEWAKVQMKCPLCRQPFDRIIYDVKSEFDFKELTTEDLCKKYSSSTSNIPILNPFLNGNYILTYRNPLRNSQLLANEVANREFEVGTLEHRRYIYSADLYVLPCGNGVTTRRRECNARFYRNNPAITHRLVPFLNLELKALIHNENERRLVLKLIMNSLPKVNINSSKFQRLISQYTLHRTVHFIHELFNFAISIFDDLRLYYRFAIYVTRSETSIVQINYTEDLFDLADPYNFRISSRNIYNDLNNMNTFNPCPTTSSSSIGNLTNSNDATNLQNVLSDENSNDSDIDILYEGPVLPITEKNRSKTNNDSDKLNQIKATTANNLPTETILDPKPSTSGLQNNKVNLNPIQARTLYADDSDSDYDSDYDRSKQSKLLNLFYKSDNEKKLKRSLVNNLSSDDDDSIKYVGYIKSRHLRTPELIELTDEDDNQSNLGVNLKRLKTEHKDDMITSLSQNEDKIASKQITNKLTNCRCKVKCTYVCKKEQQ